MKFDPRSVPGVTFPEPEQPRGRVGSVRRRLRVAFSVPSWAVTTQEAAEMLGISFWNTRCALQHARVKCVVVKRPGIPPTLCWDRKRVQERATRIHAMLVSEPPKGCIPSDEAIALLGVARSTLYRFVHSGKLREHKVIMNYPKEFGGRRLKSYFSRDEVEAMAVRLRRRRKLEKELHTMLREERKGGAHE